MSSPKPHMIDLLMISVTLIWGLNFSVMKGLYRYFDPLAFTGLRFVVAVAALILVSRLRRQPLRMSLADLPTIAALGLLSQTVYQLLFVHGLARTRAGNAGLLMSSTPIFAYFCGVMLKRELFSRTVLVGTLLSITGVFAIVLFGPAGIQLGGYRQGDAMILGSAVCWGWYTGAAGGMILKYGAVRLTTWVMLTGTVFMLPVLIPAAASQDWSAIPAQGWVAFCYSTFLSIVYCYLVWSFAIEHSGVSRTAIYSNVTPIVALLGGWFLLGEQPALAQITGIALILAGVFIVRSHKPHAVGTGWAGDDTRRA
jgi:drug/metabolite transporter (DMT)-like permease